MLLLLQMFMIINLMIVSLDASWKSVSSFDSLGNACEQISKNSFGSDLDSDSDISANPDAKLLATAQNLKLEKYEHFKRVMILACIDLENKELRNFSNPIARKLYGELYEKLIDYVERIAYAPNDENYHNMASNTLYILRQPKFKSCTFLGHNYVQYLAKKILEEQR